MAKFVFLFAVIALLQTVYGSTVCKGYKMSTIEDRNVYNPNSYEEPLGSYDDPMEEYGEFDIPYDNIGKGKFYSPTPKRKYYSGKPYCTTRICTRPIWICKKVKQYYPCTVCY